MLVFFGFVATAGSAYVQVESVPAEAWWGAVAMGLLACGILLANNIRDVPTDRVAGKRTLAVRIGAPAARRLYAACVAGAFVAVVAIGVLRPWALLGLLALPLAIRPRAARPDPRGAACARRRPRRHRPPRGRARGAARRGSGGVVTLVRHELRIGDRPVTLLEGPAGWGESSPLPGYPCDPDASERAAIEAACDGWPAPVRTWVPVNALVDGPGRRRRRARRLPVREGQGGAAGTRRRRPPRRGGARRRRYCGRGACRRQRRVGRRHGASR